MPQAGKAAPELTVHPVTAGETCQAQAEPGAAAWETGSSRERRESGRRAKPEWCGLRFSHHLLSPTNIQAVKGRFFRKQLSSYREGKADLSSEGICRHITGWHSATAQRQTFELAALQISSLLSEVKKRNAHMQGLEFLSD